MTLNKLSDEKIQEKLEKYCQKYSFNKFIYKAIKELPEANPSRALEQINAIKENNLIIRSTSNLQTFKKLLARFEQLMFKEKLLVHPGDRANSTEINITSANINFYEEGILFTVPEYYYIGSGSVQTGRMNFVVLKYENKYYFLASRLESILNGRLENPE